MKKKIIFARIHYPCFFGINFKNEIYEDLLAIKTGDGFFSDGGYRWYLSELEKENIEGEEYVNGIITKIIPKEDVVSIDEHTKEEINTTNEDIKDNESLFVLFPDKNLIGFEVSKTLTKKQFFSALQAGYLGVNSHTQPSFDLIYDEKFLMERLSEFKMVSFARFTLKTTNPDSREEFEKIDDLFQATNSETNKLCLIPKKIESLDFKSKDSLVKQGLAMSSSGYGGGEIRGTGQDGSKTTIKTGDNNLKEVIIEETETKDEVKRKIILTFKDITN